MNVIKRYIGKEEKLFLQKEPVTLSVFIDFTNNQFTTSTTNVSQKNRRNVIAIEEDKDYVFMLRDINTALIDVNENIVQPATGSNFSLIENQFFAQSFMFLSIVRDVEKVVNNDLDNLDNNVMVGNKLSTFGLQIAELLDEP